MLDGATVLITFRLEGVEWELTARSATGSWSGDLGRRRLDGPVGSSLAVGSRFESLQTLLDAARSAAMVAINAQRAPGATILLCCPTNAG